MPEQRKSFFDWLVSLLVELREDCAFVFIYVCGCGCRTCVYGICVHAGVTLCVCVCACACKHPCLFVRWHLECGYVCVHLEYGSSFSGCCCVSASTSVCMHTLASMCLCF